MSKTRKDRSDIQVGNLEKKHDLAPGAIRNPDQTDARSDKELGKLQREYGEEALKSTLDSASQSQPNEQTD
jgi:hypothetical protein